MQDAARGVMRQDRRGLAVVGVEASLHRVAVVVGAAGEAGAMTHIAHARDGGGLERVVIPRAAGGAGEAPGDALDQGRVIDLQLHHRVQRHAPGRQQPIQRLGLRHCAREAVQDEAIGAIRLLDPVSQHADDDVVGDELTRLHHRFGFLADRRGGGHLGAEHVARRDLRDPVLVSQTLRLRSLSRPRRAQENQFHRRPFTLFLRMRPSYWCASRCDWICVTVSIVTETTIRIEVPPK